MSTVEITAGTVESLEAYARAAAGGALTGSSNLRVQVRRVSDGFFLDFNDDTFKDSGWTTRLATLSEVDATNAAGEYELTGGVDTTGWNAGSYAVTFSEVTSALVANGPQFAVGEIRVVAATPSSLSARLPAALVSGRIDASVGAVANDAITASAIASNAITSAKIAADAIGAAQIAAGAISSSEAPALANLDAAVSTRLATASYAAPPSAADVADAVLDEALAGHVTAGTVGEAVGRLDVVVSTRAAPGAAMDLVDNAVDAGAVAASAVTEIQSGLATATNVSAVGTIVSAVGVAVEAIAVDVDDVQARLPAALVLGRMDSYVGAMATDTITAGAVAASAVTEIQNNLATAASVAAVDTKVTDVQERIPAALVSGRIDASVGAMAANTLTAAALAADAVAEITAGVGAAVWATAVSAPASGTYGRYVQRIFQLGFNRLELASTGGGQNVLYADDASTPMVTFTLRDVAGSALTITGGSPARRGAGVES